MKKFTKIATLALCACFGMGVFAGCGGKDQNEVVIWGAVEEQTLLKNLVDEFKAANPDVTENIRVEVQSVWNAQSIVANDPEAAADVIMIPHDQVGIMAQSGLLAEIRDGTAATFATEIRENNDPATVQQATYNGKLYGFPLTMDTYIMYYTTGIFDDTQQDLDAFLSSVDEMLEAPMGEIPGGKGKKAKAFGFNIGDGFYFNMGFFAMGCTLYGEDGTDVSACDWNSENGMKFMKYAATNFRHYVGGAQSGDETSFSSDDVKNLATAVLNNRLGACISGGWEMQDTFKNAANIKYRTLPSITIDGEQKPLVSFSNSKLYVVNNFSQHKATAARLASFITSEQNQLRYATERGYYPSNLNAQNNAAVKDDPFFRVIKAQLELSEPVPVIPEIGNYWEPAKSLGTSIWNGSLAGDDASLQAALDKFVRDLSGTI